MSLVLAAASLRRATDEDAEFERQVFTESRPEHVFLPEDVVRQQFAAQCAQHSTAVRLVIVADDEPVGRLLVRESGTELRIVDIAVLESRRGLGIGSAVLVQLVERARAAGVPVRLSVRPENAGARALYSRLGFAELAASDTGIELTWEAA